MVAVLNWGLHHWYVFLFLSFFGFFEGVRDFFAGIIEAVIALGDRRHERRLEIARAQGAIPVAEIEQRAKPGRCVHRRVKQVRDRNDELVAWLCMSCDRKLPADWAVAQEDL
jgi:hypothetical protein